MSRILDCLPTKGYRFLPLLKAIGNAYIDLALDPTNAERLLFNDLSLEDIWNEVPFRGGVLARTMEEFKKLVKGYGLSKMVRVLELNAGHGCLTKALGNAIKEAKLEVPNLKIEYYCADLNFNLAERSSKTSPWQPVEPVRIAFDGRIDLQGIPQVDIVVGLNTLYTLPSLKIGLLSIQSILLPGGFLILTELDRRVPEGIKPGLIWLDYVFGGLEGWFDSPNSNDEDNAAALWETSTRLIFKELGYLDPWFIEIENSEHVCHRTLITQIPRLSDRKVLNYPNATPLPQVLITIPRVAVGGGVSTTVKETSEVSTLTKRVDSFAYHYHFGEDAAMMKFLSSLDARAIVKLVLYTIVDGQNNSALVGISRVVRQEFPVWHVQLIVFDPALGSTLLSDYLSNHLLFLPASPPELYIKANRICEATELRLLEDVDRKGPLGVCPYAWKEGQEPWTHYLPPIGDDDVEIQVLSLQQPDFRGSCFGFSGRICQRGSRAMIPIGEMVVGISLDGPMASRLVCHWERVAKLTHEFQPQLYATIIRSMVTCDLIMEKLPKRTEHNNHILIHGGPPGLRLGTAICLSRILIWKGWTVYFTSDSVDDVPVDTARIRYSTKDSDALVRVIKNQTFYKGIGCVISFTKETALISASLEILWEAPAVILLVAKEDALHSLSHLPGQKPNQSFTFIDPEERLRQDHHLVRDAILNFSKNSEYPVSVWDHKENLMAVIPPVLNPDAMVLRAGVVSGTPAFNPRATYVLVEGVCWMGLAMAKFIIEHGGLHVVISCRSSQNFLETSPDGKEKILLDSFRELPGVTVEVASAQVECASSMRALFRNQEFPIAGVIYFAPTSRGTAMRSSSQKSWDRNYLCRTGSVRVLLDSLDVEMLDWIVLCSPLSSTIGQSGQADICGAQTIVNSITAGIRNCTNVVIPPILDQDPPLFLKTGEKMDTWQKCEKFGMKTADVCKHILDAIWCMPKSNHYIPDMDFAGLAKGGLSENMKWLKGTIVPKIVLPDSLPGITRIVSETLGVAPDEISVDIELRKVGMDAFQAIQLSQRLESEIGLKISYPRLFVPGLTVGEILQESGCARTKMDSTSHTIPFFNQESMFKPDYLAVVRSGNRIAIGTPIFIISPPTIPTDSAFNFLANELPFPAYILPNPQLTPDSSLDTISEWYTQTILGILADCTSSFHIISFSDISPVILHLAEKLLNNEHTIESLVLLDSSPSLVYSRSFNSFMNDRIKSNYWEDVVLDRIEDMATLDTSLGLMSNKVQQAKEFFDGNLAKENKWCSEHLDTYIQFAKILHAASTAVLNGPNRNPWKCFERMGPKVFLAKAKSGVVTEPWFCDSEIDKNWGIPETLDLFVKEYDCGHCGILARWTGLVESLRVFWGVDTGLERGSDMYEGGWDDYGYSSGIEGVEGCLAGGVVSA
ncbi:hypothetical protein HOY82DRAFT_668760 [Tuber indicum]|nr:hypothetical protein HOY82DRAFT_668760 [Tuber indicum]